jgi:hypothetical protein
MRLIDAIATTAESSGRNTTLMMRLCPVTASDTTTVTVTVDGTSVKVARAKGYTPVVGERAIVLMQAGAWAAVDAIAG